MIFNTKPILGVFENLTTTERDNLVNPQKNKVIYNTTLDQWQGNKGTPAAPVWVTLG